MDLCSIRAIKAFDVRGLMKQHNVPRIAWSLGRTIDDAINLVRRIGRQEIGNGLGYNIIKRLIIRHNWSRDALAKGS